MKRFGKWCPIIFLLFFVGFIPRGVASNYAREKILETVKAYYEACKEENMEAYLAIMYLEGENAKSLAEEARRVWRAVDTIEYSLENFSVALNNERDVGVVQYTVKAQVAPENGSPGEKFSINADYVMVLRYDEDRWKVEMVQRKDLFLQNLKSLYTLQNVQELVKLTNEDTAAWQDEWHDPQGNGYIYRVAVDIFSEIKAACYQLAITLDPKSFNYPHAQPDGRDIRFVAESEDKLFELPYWIEEWNPDGESKIWVKVPHLGDTVRVYLYYGNSEVSSRSSGKDVFEFFDDFSEFAEWSVYGNKPTVATVEGRKVIEMKGWSEIAHTIKLDQSNYAFESLSKLTSGMEAYMPFFGFGSSERSLDEDNAYQFGYNVWGGMDNIRVFKDGSSKINVTGDPARSRRTGWVRTMFTKYNGKLTQIIHDKTTGEQKITAQDTHWIESIPKEVGVIVWDGASYAIDWLFVRNYLEPEPVYSLRSEEKKPSRIKTEQILSLIKACQESISEQSEMIKKMKKEIELLKTRIDQLEKRIEELRREKSGYQSILDLSYADESWARKWKVLSTLKELPGGGKAGFYSEAVKIGAAHPNPERRGILYLHPPAQEEPVIIARKVTVTGSKPSLKMGVSGNRDIDGDWALTVKVNGKPLEKEKIIAGAEGWQDLSFDLTAFSGQTVDIQIEARANDWYFEFVFFDYIQIEENDLPLSGYKELPREVADFQGVWNTGWGKMILTQSGTNVTGTYTHQDGKIKGIVKGNILTGKWSEAPSYSEPQDAGDVELELSEDGSSFSGRWRYGSSGEWDGVWTGTRVDKK